MSLLFSGKWLVVSGNAIMSIIACLVLTACGFQPVYGVSSACSANSPIASGIKIAASDGKVTTAIAGDERLLTSVSRKFTENLEDLLNPATGYKPKIYRLEVAISQSTGAVGISRDGLPSPIRTIASAGCAGCERA